LLLIDEVPTDRILQIFLPVQLDGAWDVTPVIGGGVFIDLDENDVLITGMFGDPISVDEYFLPAHVVSSPGGLLARRPG
jgi:hypothetical protein